MTVVFGIESDIYHIGFSVKYILGTSVLDYEDVSRCVCFLFLFFFLWQVTPGFGFSIKATPAKNSYNFPKLQYDSYNYSSLVFI